jgi:hypothetical protein
LLSVDQSFPSSESRDSRGCLPGGVQGSHHVAGGPFTSSAVSQLRPLVRAVAGASSGQVDQR